MELRDYLENNKDNEKERKIANACIEKWGKDAQLDQLNEEISELIIELAKIQVNVNHIKRGRVDPSFLESKSMNELIGEIVDTEIMLSQLKEMFYLDLPIRRVKLAKLRRLKERVNNI